VIVTMVMMVQITANALMRTLFREPLPYTLEITQYWYMPVVAFLGFMAAQRRGQHIAADLIFQALPRGTKRAVLAALYLLAAVALAGMAYYGWHEAIKAWEIRKHAGISPLPAWPLYFLPSLAFGVMTVQFVAAAIGFIRHGVGLSIEEAELQSVDLEDGVPHTPQHEER
ncbi:TRAP transporter small permease subunit, partial [Georgenia ruanii]|nr:TRAP transporter small permease subunit [Georgenia ruanii]